MLRKFLSDDSGATAIEYGLIAAAMGLALVTASLIALAIIVGVGGLATALEGLWGDNNAKIGVALQ